MKADVIVKSEEGKVSRLIVNKVKDVLRSQIKASMEENPDKAVWDVVQDVLSPDNGRERNLAAVQDVKMAHYTVRDYNRKFAEGEKAAERRKIGVVTIATATYVGENGEATRAFARGIAFCAECDDFCESDGQLRSSGRAMAALTRRESSRPVKNKIVIEKYGPRLFLTTGIKVEGCFKSQFGVVPTNHELRLLAM